MSMIPREEYSISHTATIITLRDDAQFAVALGMPYAGRDGRKLSLDGVIVELTVTQLSALSKVIRHHLMEPAVDDAPADADDSCPF